MTPPSPGSADWCRARLLDWLDTHNGWVGALEVAAWCSAQLHLSGRQGQGDLGVLVRQGRLERRRTQATGAARYGYRVIR